MADTSAKPAPNLGRASAILASGTTVFPTRYRGLGTTVMLAALDALLKKLNRADAFVAEIPQKLPEATRVSGPQDAECKSWKHAPCDLQRVRGVASSLPTRAHAP